MENHYLYVISNVWKSTFLERTTRFTAKLVKPDGEIAYCHLHDPGRLKHLLHRGAKIYARNTWRPGRKTNCDIVAVEDKGKIVLEDTRIPNKVFPALADKLFPDFLGIERETKVLGSRLDFKVNTLEGPIYVEVKGTNLVEHSTALFPDAPSRRASRHLDILLMIARNGLKAALTVIVLRNDAKIFKPNRAVDPEFSRRLCSYRRVVDVKIAKLDPKIRQNSIEIYYGGLIPLKC